MRLLDRLVLGMIFRPGLFVGLALAAQLAIGVGVVYVAVHFIVKYW